jgi:hypothetical protein
MIPTKSQIDKIFKEACDGFGFEEVDESQYTPDGIWCTGCRMIHKRPTKMYTNGREVMCKWRVAVDYNPEDC